MQREDAGDAVNNEVFALIQPIFLGRASQYVRGFQLVRVEEGGHLIRQLRQDALGKRHTVPLQ